MKQMTRLSVIVFLFLSQTFITFNGYAKARNKSSLTLNKFTDLILNSNDCLKIKNTLKHKYAIDSSNLEAATTGHLKETECNKVINHVAITNVGPNSGRKIKNVDLTFAYEHEYYLFEKKKGQFLYIGKIEPHTPWSKGELKVYQLKDQLIFSVANNREHGSGLSLRNTDFYIPTNNKLKKIFSVERDGFMSHWGKSFDRGFKSTITEKMFNQNIIEIIYDINYSFFHKTDSIDLFKLKKKLILKYQNGRIVEKDSPSSIKDIEEIMSHGEEYFCKKYHYFLGKLRLSQDNRVRNWVYKMNKHCHR